ncbi:MAG: phosphoribosylaminoimidazolesuccinocarboxamide synthase, partial [Deltaproteobacteria bacterium]|nr:phosphoribosylaminoimidazolesuccinocarboxamide synthase [Deltaproteobacteria bacterium]
SISSISASFPSIRPNSNFVSAKIIPQVSAISAALLYIAGSGWESYLESQSICGTKLPEGLLESDRLPEPLFTPSTKEDVGRHDVNISFSQAQELVGDPIYKSAAEIAETCGIILADTKFEFGLIDGKLALIDEILTPDSSRFWPKATYKPGKAQKSYDKQYVRDYLISVNWDKKPPAPRLPADVVENTRRKYEEALERLTGKVDNKGARGISAK